MPSFGKRNMEAAAARETSLVKFTTALGLLLICAAAAAAELHPIVEVQIGYFFGAVSGGKWLKAAESAKSGDGRR
jgi:hypothetical protein